MVAHSMIIIRKHRNRKKRKRKIIPKIKNRLKMKNRYFQVVHPVIGNLLNSLIDEQKNTGMISTLFKLIIVHSPDKSNTFSTILEKGIDQSIDREVGSINSYLGVNWSVSLYQT